MKYLFLVTALAISLITYLGLVDSLAIRSSDFFFAPQTNTSQDISIVTVDPKSADSIPALIKTIRQTPAKAIGFHFNPPPSVIEEYKQDPVLVFPNDNTETYVFLDNDNVARTSPCKQSFALSVAQKINPNASCPDDKLRINYTLDSGNIETIPAQSILDHQALPTHPIVLVGLSDGSSNPLLTPLSGNPQPGVIVQANIINTIISRRGLIQLPKEYLILGNFIALLIFYLILKRFYFLKGLFAFVVFVFADFAVSYILFEKGYLADYIYLPIGLIATFITQLSYGYVEQQHHKSYISEAFGKYVNPDVVNQLIKNKNNLKLGGDRRNLSILFSDIESFTPMAESMEPEKVVSLLNRFCTLAHQYIDHHHGTLDKFVGDEIIAFWNAPLDQPHHAALAAYTALAVKKEISKITEISVGVGLNSGDSFVGNIGSPKRFSYTAIGDAVNITQRLQGLTRFYGSTIIVSKQFIDTLDSQGDFGNFVFRRLDRVIVKGRTKPIDVFELVSSKNEINQEQADMISNYEIALEMYRLGYFERAYTLFRLGQIKFLDRASELMARRSYRLKRKPPKDWIGVFDAVTHRVY